MSERIVDSETDLTTMDVLEAAADALDDINTFEFLSNTTHALPALETDNNLTTTATGVVNKNNSSMCVEYERVRENSAIEEKRIFDDDLFVRVSDDNWNTVSVPDGRQFLFCLPKLRTFIERSYGEITGYYSTIKNEYEVEIELRKDDLQDLRDDERFSFTDINIIDNIGIFPNYQRLHLTINAESYRMKNCSALIQQTNQTGDSNLKEVSAAILVDLNVLNTDIEFEVQPPMETS